MNTTPPEQPEDGVTPPSGLEWLEDASDSEKLDWLLQRRFASIHRDRTVGRISRLMAYCSVILVAFALWLTITTSRTDARRSAAIEARRIAADVAQAQYAQCISTANGRATIRQAIRVLLQQSPNPDSPQSHNLQVLIDDPNGPLASQTCTPPVTTPGTSNKS